MNPFILLIGVAIVVLMVLFGRNPIEELREQRAKGMTGDPLVDAIKEHNDQSHTNIFGGQGGGLPNGSPGFSTTMPNTALNPMGQQPAPPPSNPNTGQDNYYPPPPLTTQPYGQPNPLGPQSRLWPRSAPTFYLGSGQPVRFSSTRVYTLNAQGKVVPMPDGRYPMFGGKIYLVVKGGHKMMTIKYD